MSIPTAILGHEDQFLPPKLSARSMIKKQTAAATRGNGRGAPGDPMGIWLAT
jgi:hypothetical protein